MLYLSSIVRQTIFVAFETKSFLRLIRNSRWIIPEIPIKNVYKRKTCRYYCSTKAKDEVVKSTSDEVSASTAENVKETAKTIYYSGVVIIGLGITGIVCYTIFSELFSQNSANSIYSKTLDRCLKNEKVVLSLGVPIKAFGEENSRGRRQHTNHLLYEKDGVNFLRMKFFIKGSRKKATVHLEMKENEKKNFEYRYLFVQLDEYPYTTIVLEDNRNEMAIVQQQTTTTTTTTTKDSLELTT